MEVGLKVQVTMEIGMEIGLTRMDRGMEEDGVCRGTHQRSQGNRSED